MCLRSRNVPGRKSPCPVSAGAGCISCLFPFVSQLRTNHGSKIASGAILQHVRNVPSLLSFGKPVLMLFAKASIKKQFDTLVCEGRGAEPADWMG